MDNKKLIAGFGYQEGRISSWDGKRTYTQAAPQMAKHCCDNGADEILIYDWSVTDDDHEAHCSDQRGLQGSGCPGHCRRQSKTH
ncbi:MAG: hypothetical protein ACLS6H_09330 [Clostridium sp.]